MEKGIEFTEILDMLNPTETIDSMIRHLQLIKNDIEDKDTNKETLIYSINIRNGGLQTLNNLLMQYLYQHDIKFIADKN